MAKVKKNKKKTKGLVGKDLAKSAPSSRIIPAVAAGKEGDSSPAALRKMGLGGFPGKKRFVDAEDGYIVMLQDELDARRSKDSKYSLRKLADDIGIESGTLSRIMGGLRPLSHKTAFRILDRLRWDQARRSAFMESIESQARHLDKGAISLERIQRAGGNVLDGVSQHGFGFLAMERGNGRDEAGELVVKGGHDTIKTAKAQIDRVVIKNYKHQRIFITTAVQGAKADLSFLKSIETYLKQKDAELIILTTRAHLKPLREEEYPLDKAIHDKYHDNIYQQVQLNRFLTAINIDARPAVSDPLSALAELGADEGRSYIIAHTQQRMQTYPNGLHNVARVQQCTGAVTLPVYRNNKAGLLGDKRHVIGGVIVEIHNDMFHVRVVQADTDGSFIDLGVRYLPNGSVRSGEMERPEALVRGDDHGGPEIYGDPEANEAIDEITQSLKPRRVFIHDLFDGASISHHNEHNINAKLLVPQKAHTLEEELAATRRFLHHIKQRSPKDSELFIVSANHNEHLHRYLNEGRWIKDAKNYKTALELAFQYHVKGRDPLVQGIDPEQILATWLGRNETVNVEGICASHHGDRGINGSRGSLKADAVAFGRSVGGHSHSPGIYRGAIRVGSTSRLRLPYNDGPSSWAHCLALIYKRGLFQLIITVNGVWCLDDKKSPKPAESDKKRGKRKKS